MNVFIVSFLKLIIFTNGQNNLHCSLTYSLVHLLICLTLTDKSNTHIYQVQGNKGQWLTSWLTQQSIGLWAILCSTMGFTDVFKTTHDCYRCCPTTLWSLSSVSHIWIVSYNNVIIHNPNTELPTVSVPSTAFKPNWTKTLSLLIYPPSQGDYTQLWGNTGAADGVTKEQSAQVTLIDADYYHTHKHT